MTNLTEKQLDNIQASMTSDYEAKHSNLAIMHIDSEDGTRLREFVVSNKDGLSLNDAHKFINVLKLGEQVAITASAIKADGINKENADAHQKALDNYMNALNDE